MLTDWFKFAIPATNEFAAALLNYKNISKNISKKHRMVTMSSLTVFMKTIYSLIVRFPCWLPSFSVFFFLSFVCFLSFFPPSLFCLLQALVLRWKVLFRLSKDAQKTTTQIVSCFNILSGYQTQPCLNNAY